MCVYKDYYRDNTYSGSFTKIENNIAYIPFSLKNTEGPSGCIDTTSNDIKLNITFESDVSRSDLTIDISIYFVYHTIIKISENKIIFPYGYI